MAGMAIADQVLQKQDKDGMLRRALERIIQLYTDKSHFIYELLQNAEDAGATKIMFEQFVDRLEVQHDGHPFTVKNLQGLCDIGKSDKTDDLNQIGEFGVGFKSVFGICERVLLFSHPKEGDDEYQKFAIEIRDFTHPVDIEDQFVEEGYTTKFVFPYSVGFTFSGFSTIKQLNEVISKRLQNLGITTLLFMKNLKSIDYRISLPQLNASGTYLLEKNQINNHCALVSAVGEKDRLINRKEKGNFEEVSYLVFTRDVKGVQGERTIDIAFAVTVNESGGYTFKPSRSPYISVYFPTETESKLDFIVQGPYRTTPNRSSVPADDADNIELAKQTAKLLKDSIIELRDAGELNFSLLNILPVDSEAFFNAPLFECVYDETLQMLLHDCVLPCKDGAYASADHVKIARGNDFAEIFSDDLITELINDGREYHWLPTFLTETNRAYESLYKYLVEELDIDVIRPENLRNAFNRNPSFLIDRDDDWLIQMYNMYDTVAAAFSKQKGGSNMLTAEFIKTSDGRFVAPYRKSDGSSSYSFYSHGRENASYLPNVFLPTKDKYRMDDIQFVDENILNHCYHFFTEILNLQKPNEYEYFIRDFRKRYDEDDEINDDQHITDVKRLLHYRKNDDYREEINSLIQNHLFIRCIEDGEPLYYKVGDEKILLPVNREGMSLEQYYAHIADCTFVDLQFYKNEDIDEDMLEILGVSDEVAIGLHKVNGEYFTGKQGRQPDWNTYGDFRWKLSIDKLDEALEYITSHPKAANSMAKSSFIFRFLQIHEDTLTGMVYVGGSTPNMPNACSEIVTKLRRDGPKHQYYGMKWDGKWLYTESGELVSQKEISKYELHPQLYADINEESELYEILGFKKSEDEQLAEAEREYDQFDEETKEQFFEIELRRRFGISIEDLEENFGETFARNSEHIVYSPQNEFVFPSAKVKNWESLRKHAAEVLVFASPVKYEYKVRRLRVSRPDSEIDAYLRGMYKVDGSHKYACQMCHEPVTTFEKCQLTTEMGKELDAMYLCMCPNCASEYRRMRSYNYELENFIDSINSLDDQEISLSDPVKIDFGNESIWFTQTHIAEIRELMSLKEAADSFVESSPVPKSRTAEPDINNTKNGDSAEDNHASEDEAVEINAGTDVYKDYIGKLVKHRTLGKGIVTECDGKLIHIDFIEGPAKGTEKRLSLEMCLKNGFITILS